MMPSAEPLTCSVCQEPKPRTRYYFRPDYRRPPHLTRTCRACVNAAHGAWRAAHRRRYATMPRDDAINRPTADLVLLDARIERRRIILDRAVDRLITVQDLMALNPDDADDALMDRWMSARHAVWNHNAQLKREWNQRRELTP